MTPPWRILFFPLFLVGIFGLGSLLLPRDSSLNRNQKRFLAGCLGTAFTQSLVLLGLPLWVSVAAAFLGCVTVFRFRSQLNKRDAVLLLLSAIPVLMILGENILGWDARAIWFFHGNLLYNAGSFFSVPWTDPQIASSHPDYPKLIGIFTAQSSLLLGVWNERWPKLSLLVLLALSQAGMSATSLSNRRAWLADFLLLAGIGYLLWNGYADGYLAVFTFLATFFLGDALENPRSGSFWCGLGSLSLLAQTKNEGLVLALLLLALFWGLGQRGRHWIARPQTWLLALPVLLWVGIRIVFGIHNDLEQGMRLEVPLRRLGDPHFWGILGQHWLSRGALMFWELGLLAVLAISGLAPRHRLRSPAFRLSLLAFVLYSGVVFSAYLTTYWPLLDHLRSSFSRVAIPLYCLLLVSLLEALPRRTQSN